MSATTEQFSLRWNNFHSNLTSGFHELLEAADMVDVTLAVDGHFLQAHKVVLSICSPYFKQMFKVNPCTHPIVILKDIGHENMKDILEFMYMGQVSVLRENLTQFLRTAELLQVKGLTGEDSNEDPPASKDIKPECDNEEDNEIYNQLIETDVELPVFTQQPHSGPSNFTAGSSKRPSKSSNGVPHTKRPKSDNQMPKHDFEAVKSKQENANNDNSSNADSSSAGTQALDTEDNKDLINIKTAWENSFSSASTTDLNSSEHDLLSTEAKGHVFCPYCCRKFVNRYNLKVHVRDKHEDTSIDLGCQVCGKTMRNQSCLRVHMYHHRKQMLEAAGLF